MKQTATFLFLLIAMQISAQSGELRNIFKEAESHYLF